MVEIIQYSGHSGVPMPTGAGTWADVLLAGNETLGTTPSISEGDGLHFGGDNSISVDNSLELSTGIDLTVDVGGNYDITSIADYFVSAGGIYSLFAQGDVEIFSNGGTLWLDAGDPGDPSGLILLEAPAIEVNSPSMLFANDLASPITIGVADGNNNPVLALLGSSAVSGNNDGGNVNIRGGEPTGTGTGGGLHISPGSPGVGAGTPGSINITNGAGNTMIYIDGNNIAVGGSQPILIDTAGIAFWDGTPAMKPVCTTELQVAEALGAMGLIDWAP